MSLPRNLALRSTAEIFAKGTSALLMIVAARALGSEAFGWFSIAWASGWMLATSTDLGLHLITLREVVRADVAPGRVTAAAIATKLCLTVAAFAVLAGVSPWLAGAHIGVLWSVTGALVALSYLDLGQHLLRARGAFREDAIVQIGTRTTCAVGGLVGLYAGGLAGLGFGLLAGAVLGAAGAGAVALAKYEGATLGREAWGRVGWLLRRSLPVGAGVTLSILYYRVDLFLLDAFAGSTIVGIYAGAYRIFESSQLLPAVCMTVLFPRLAATAREPAGEVLRAKALAGLASVGLVVAIAGWVVARPLVSILYGDGYAAAVAPLVVLFCAAPLMYANYLLTQDLVSRGRPGRYATIAALALAFNVVANCLAIPRYGALGAAAITVGTEAVVFVGCAASLWGAWLLEPGHVETAATWLAAAALASLPFETDRLAIGVAGFTVTISEALVVAAVVAAVVALARGGARGLVPDWSLGAAAALFVAVLLASAAFAPEQRVNAFKFSLRMAAGASFGLAVCGLVRRSPARAATLLGTYVAGVAVASCLGVAEAVAPDRLDPALALFRDAPIYAAGLRRVSSTYGYPNVTATAIAMALPAAAAFAVTKRGAARAIAIAVAIMMAIALVATYSRGGLVAAFCGLAALALAGRARLALGATVLALALAAAWSTAAFAGAALASRGISGDESGLLGARIEPVSRSLEVAPGAEGIEQVRITNTGAIEWRSTPDAPFALVSRWYDASGRAFDVEGYRTALPESVAQGETIVVDGGYVAPDAPGRYVLAWDIYIEHRLRFSERGVATGDVDVRVGSDAPGAIASAPRNRPPLDDVYIAPERGALWRAAWAMFRERPLLGFGPDTYRLTYGRYLGLEKWDNRIYANNLALELLATTGALGFAAFGLLTAIVARRGWRLARASRGGRTDPLLATLAVAAIAALVAFFVHGAVDYFLEFTAGYVPFWTFAGLVAGLQVTDRR
jgi:O-antigen/teichoic acid export membrane protein